MVFQIDDSAWIIILILTGSIGILGVGLFVAYAKNVIRGPGIIIGLVVIATCCVVGIVLATQNRAENNASFDKQLMAEYHATSSSSFTAMNMDFHRYGGATAVFTKDGKATPVFVKLVSQDGNNVTVSFSALGGNSLYPKSNE